MKRQRLSFSVLAPLGLVLLGAACGPSPTPSPTTPSATTGRTGPSAQLPPSTDSVPLPGTSRSPNSVEQGQLQQLLEQTVRVRGLEFSERVNVKIQNDTRIRAHLDSMMEDEEMRKAEMLYRALGLWQSERSLREVLGDVTQEQVVGYYDVEGEFLALRESEISTLMSPGQSAMQTRILVTHELVHALQAQRLGLRPFDEMDLNSDATQAMRSLAEGDATLAHTFAAISIPLPVNTADPQVQAMLNTIATARPPTSSTGALASAPIFLRKGLTEPYFAGQAFCIALFQDGHWDAVNGAYNRPPASMEQVLHPEKYVSGEAPEAIELGEFPEIAAAGFTVVDEDTLGELEFQIYFESIGVRSFAQAAAGWGGDRVRVYERDGQPAVIWESSWDNPNDTQEAYRAAATPPDGAVVMLNRRVLIVRGFDDALTDTITQAWGAR